MKSKIFILLSFIGLSHGYQSYWIDGVVQNFEDSGRANNKTSIRPGFSFSKDKFAVWGKVEQIFNKSYGNAQSGELSGFYRYADFSTTLSIGFSNDFRLKSNRLYSVEQRAYFFSEKFNPYLTYLSEEYLSTPISHYDYYRLGIDGEVYKSIKLLTYIQTIRNTFSDSSAAKNGLGFQVLVHGEQQGWSWQTGYIQNKLYRTIGRLESTDKYVEWPISGEFKIDDNYYLKAGISFINQSSNLIDQSSSVGNNTEISSRLFSLGLMKVIP